MSQNTYKYTLNKSYREEISGHKSFVIWLTGLPSSGKSTIANDLELELYKRNLRTFVIDGDNIRHTINKDLSFTEKDRTENIRRAGEIARLFVDAGVIVICAFVSPFEKDRKMVRSMFKEDEFFEVFVSCSLEACKKRDKKGVYKNFSSDVTKKYEIPFNANITVNTELYNYNECTANIITVLEVIGMLQE
jgi:adenylyl-sulfate kinase